jgi:hypothetical protein
LGKAQDDAWHLGSVLVTGVRPYPLREKSGTPVTPATQRLSGSRVNVMDPCATCFEDLARGSVASRQTNRFARVMARRYPLALETLGER